MLSSYYCKAFDSSSIFNSLNIKDSEGYEENLNKHNVISISFSEITDYVHTYKEYMDNIINTLKEEKVPDFLNPLRVYKDEKYEDKICFFQNDGNLLGWCISSLINAGTIDLRCTYVLKRYRNNKYVFAFWKIMTFHIKRKYPNIERLIFYYDNKCKSLEAFYKRIFEGSNYKPFYRLNYKLLLSGKSF